MRIETNNYSRSSATWPAGSSPPSRSRATTSSRQRVRVHPQRQVRRQQLGQQQVGGEKSDLNSTFFGATLSGPVVKNRVFFFADYQGQRTDRPGAVTATVAPDSYRDGSAFGSRRRSSAPIAQHLLADTNGIRARIGRASPWQLRQHRQQHDAQPPGRRQARRQPGAERQLFIRGSIGNYDTSLSKTAFPAIMGNGYLSDAQNVGFNWTHSFTRPWSTSCASATAT